jgi:hypothetical protein
MAKRRIKFKLGEIKITGVELEIEDEREQATAALATFQNQLASALQPAVSKALLGAGPVIDAPLAISQNGPGSPARKRRRRGSSAVGKAADGSSEAVAFVHDPTKFGNPQETWSTPKKGVGYFGS